MTIAEIIKVGELRPSHIMYTYGIGAIIDLPNISVMVMGLDDWPEDPNVAAEIAEERLLAAVQQVLGDQVQKLVSPPTVTETGGPSNPFDAQVGVPVATFPRWMHCPFCRLLAPLNSGLFELKTDPYHPDRARYVHVNCVKKGRPPTVLPARFLMACPKGHLDDFPWREFVHGGPSSCTGALKLTEYGPSGEARDLEVSCSCNAKRSLAQAFGDLGKKTMPVCNGRRPHLRDYEEEECKDDKGDRTQSKAILLGASNFWFPVTMNTLALPNAVEPLEQLVEANWQTLRLATSLEVVTAFRLAGNLSDLARFSDAQLWPAVQRWRSRSESGAETDAPVDLKTPEWEMFTHSETAPSTEDFRLRRVELPAPYTGALSQIILAERLREVNALIGFTRIESPGELGEPGAVAPERRSPLSRRPPKWVPATEVRGEGIFIQFNEAKVADWLSRKSVKQRSAEFFASHQGWRRARGIEPAEADFPTMRYILLHSLAHALMRQLTLECGYTAASIRERIYSRAAGDAHGPMAGVLLYTAAPDSEGTLGGLVSLGEPSNLERHFRQALEGASLCTSDPLCAEQISDPQGRILHAAACHACLFSPETSCERGNKYLDRSVLATTVDRADLAFFNPRH